MEVDNLPSSKAETVKKSETVKKEEIPKNDPGTPLSGSQTPKNEEGFVNTFQVGSY